MCYKEETFKELSGSSNCSTLGRERQLQRIAYYEAIMQELSRALRMENTSNEDLELLRSKADELGNYLSSDTWKKDFDDDEAGHLPEGLKRGVLSEDGIYNLLESYRERIDDLLNK